jgi:hypothetical protein
VEEEEEISKEEKKEFPFEWGPTPERREGPEPIEEEPVEVVPEEKEKAEEEVSEEPEYLEEKGTNWGRVGKSVGGAVIITALVLITLASFGSSLIAFSKIDPTLLMVLSGIGVFLGSLAYFYMLLKHA